jgi:PPIC-type PPIASE domain
VIRPRQALGAAALVTGAVLGSACGLTPTAATANGTTISVASLNQDLQTLGTTRAGACLLALESPQAAADNGGQGAGGSGTYTTSFAGTVLESQVGEVLAQQYAASKGLHVSTSELAAAKSDLGSTLDGEIAQATQQSASDGSVSACESADGTAMTGAQLLAGLPSGLATSQVLAQAYDEKLLADGADLSERAIVAYYEANKSQFIADCLSRIVTSSEAAANQVVAELNAGASFATLAKSKSIDTQTAATGGSLGCNFSEAELEQELEQQTLPVGQPLTPLQDPQSGQWFVYEVTSQSLQPLSSVTSSVQRELLQSTSNVNRVSKEIIAFGHRSDVSIDPRYGKWIGLAVVPPVAPPPRYLLSTASGSPDPDSSVGG